MPSNIFNDHSPFTLEDLAHFAMYGDGKVRYEFACVRNLHHEDPDWFPDIQRLKDEYDASGGKFVPQVWDTSRVVGIRVIQAHGYCKVPTWNRPAFFKPDRHCDSWLLDHLVFAYVPKHLLSKAGYVSHRTSCAGICGMAEKGEMCVGVGDMTRKCNHFSLHASVDREGRRNSRKPNRHNIEIIFNVQRFASYVGDTVGLTNSNHLVTPQGVPWDAIDTIYFDPFARPRGKLYLIGSSFL